VESGIKPSLESWSTGESFEREIGFETMSLKSLNSDSDEKNKDFEEAILARLGLKASARKSRARLLESLGYP
jgi:hypothetical protein